MKVFVSTSIALAALAAMQTRAAFPSDVASLMDASVDPCDDFYQYTCGGWTKSYSLPADKQSYAYAFDGVKERNEQIVQDILKENQPFIGELWDSCLALGNQTTLGQMHLRSVVSRISSATRARLATLAGEASTYSAALFTKATVGADPKNASVNVLHVESAGTILTNPEYLAKYETEFRKYLIQLLTVVPLPSAVAGSMETIIKAAAEQALSVERQLIAIQPTEDEKKGYYSLTHAEAVAKYPNTFAAMTKNFLLLEKGLMTNDSKVVFQSLPFMDRAEKLYASLSTTQLSPYYAALYKHSQVEYLGEPFLQASFDLFGKTIQGLAARPTRAALCTDAVTKFFPELISSHYFLKTFVDQRDENVQLIANTIQQAMGERINKAEWMDDATRKEAADKLSKITDIIGFPTGNANYSFVLKRDSYLANVQTIADSKFKTDLTKINKPVDRTELGSWSPATSAKYSLSQNTLSIPPAILQLPFYSTSSHPVQNFGAIGAVIGRELTRGFDNLGHKYDGDGSERDWWTPETSKAFEAQATRPQCLTDQYSGSEAVSNVNGTVTIGENIAGNSGVSLSFDAYHNWLKGGPVFNSNGVTDAEAEKLFFVSYAQTWCGVTSDTQSPYPFHVNSALVNSDAFAKTFFCPVGAKMNPVAKCQLW